MTKTNPLFDISESYVEIDGWVSLNLSNYAPLFGLFGSRYAAVFYDSPENDDCTTEKRTILTSNRLSLTSTQTLVPSTNMRTTTYQLRAS